MNKNNTVFFTIVLLSLISIPNSHAEFDPAVIKAGGVDIVPVLSVAESYDDNILYSESNQESDMITTLEPEVTASVESGANKYSLSAGAAIGRYSKSSEDDFIDAGLAIDLHQSFTRKATLDINVQRINEHDSRGTGYDPELDLPEPDKYHINQAKAKFSYGSLESIGKIVLNGSVLTRKFDSRRESTNTRDLDDITAGATFYFHFMPKTFLLFELSNRELVYENAKDENSVEQRVFAGARWDISALTSGTAKAGLLEKNFKNAARVDLTKFSWEISARWTPLTYSVFDIVTKGAIEESNDVDDYYIDSKTIQLKWVHFWNKSFDTTLDLDVTNNGYQSGKRNDRIKSAGVRFNYNMRRWLDISAGYRFNENQSSKDNYSYDKNVVSLSLIAGL